MRRFATVLALLLIPALCRAEMSVLQRVVLSEGGAGLSRGITFHAPLTEPANPYLLESGAASLGFARAHDATHTASYVHATTGYVTTAQNNELRIEADGALVEESRTNHVLWSGSVDHAGWSYVALKAFGATGSRADNVLGPDGNVSMELLVEDATNTYHVAYQALPGVADGSTLTGSVYLKAKERTWALLILNTSGGLKHSWFNLGTGVVGSKDAGVTSGIEAGPGGTYRVWATVAVGAIGGNSQFFFGGVPADSTTTFAGDNTSGIYAWGAQAEVGAYPLSYIPTTTTTMIRNVDLLEMPSASNIVNIAGTLAVRFDSAYTSDFRTVLVNTSKTEWPALLNTGTSNIGVFITSFKSAVDASAQPALIATRWGSGNVNAAANGVLGSEAAGSLAALDASLSIGNFSGTMLLNGHLKNFRVWNRALTDEEMKAVTR